VVADGTVRLEPLDGTLADADGNPLADGVTPRQFQPVRLGPVFVAVAPAGQRWPVITLPTSGPPAARPTTSETPPPRPAAAARPVPAAASRPIRAGGRAPEPSRTRRAGRMAAAAAIVLAVIAGGVIAATWTLETETVKSRSGPSRCRAMWNF
jgi:hypothetical protein